MRQYAVYTLAETLVITGLLVFTLAMGIALKVESDTGHPGRCAWERMWYGENEWVRTHDCGSKD